LGESAAERCRRANLGERGRYEAEKTGLLTLLILLALPNASRLIGFGLGSPGEKWPNPVKIILLGDEWDKKDGAVWRYAQEAIIKWILVFDRNMILYFF
jgi:hypothetical protein